MYNDRAPNGSFVRKEEWIVPSKVKNEYGSVEIANEALMTIRGLAAMESYGVVGMAAKRRTDGLVELLGRDNFSKGIRLTVDNDVVNVDVYIIAEYGTPLSAVAGNVMDAVHNAIRTQTGLNVAAVNVTIASIKV